MASAVVSSSFFFSKSHVFPQFLHLSVVFAFVMRNFVFVKFAGLSCESANWRISFSICCSSPTFMFISVTFFSFSLFAISDAVAIIASAKAHSCIKSVNTLNQLNILQNAVTIKVGKD